MKFCIVCIVLLFATGCVAHLENDVAVSSTHRHEIIDSSLQNLNVTQNLHYSLKPHVQERMTKDYKKHHFGIWQQRSKVDWSWVLAQARKNPGFGENLLPNTSDTIESLIHNAHFDSKPLWQPGMMSVDSSLRLLPSHKPRFLDSAIAGEGYPFDTWQNSFIFASTPVMIERKSQDGSWFLVHSSFVSGWVDARHVVFVDKKTQEQIKDLALFISNDDDLKIYSKKGHFLDVARIGKIFLGKHNHAGAELWIPYPNGDNFIAWRKSQYNKRMQPFPLAFTHENVAEITKGLLGQKYGWGGLLGNRDCSSMLRDFWGSFGLWLPRNSAAQAHMQQGNSIDLSALTAIEKEQTIIKDGLAWGSVLWLDGHIMLYVGNVQGRAIVFHNIWGLGILEGGKESRYVIGGSLFSDLWIGSTLSNIMPNKLLVERLKSMTHLFDTTEIDFQE